MITLTTLLAQGRNGGFGTYLAGAFDADETPEEWEIPAPSEEQVEIFQQEPGRWQTRKPLVALRA